MVVFPDHVCVRSERDGTEPNGRAYSVSLGNVSAPGAAQIHVPHDQSGHCEPQSQLEVVDDGDPLCAP
jgi:hypothetical protein